MTADFTSRAALVRGLSADGLRIIELETKSDHVIPLDHFVSMQRPAGDERVPPAAFTLAMRGGDRLVGEPGPVVNEKLTWLSPSLGKISVPFSKLISISRGLNLAPPEDLPKQDLVILANGDTIAGVFTDCVDLKVNLQADAGPMSIPLESVKRIIFAATAGNGAVDPSRAYRIRLNDVSMITVADAAIEGTNLKLTLQGKNAQIVTVPMSSVLGIEQLNGPVGWLSALVPVGNIQVPYVGGDASWPARFDLSVDGLPLEFEGRTFDRGIGVHAYSRLTFAIDPQWKIFRAQYAIDSHRDQPRKFADVTVRIKLDDKVVQEETHFREGVLSPVVILDLNRAKTLTLECDFGSAGDTQAHLNWLQAAFVHERPVPAAIVPVKVTPATGESASTQSSTKP